jgi:predicted alpha/beta superfamily hydrolase
MKKLSILIIFLVFSNLTFGQIREDIVIGERLTIKSEILNETFSYNIYLPPSYKTSPGKRYIVAYVLDGDKSKFHEVTGIIHSMNSIQHLKMQIPELIVVGIENNNRTRDFTPTHSMSYLEQDNIMAFSSSGKADNFLQFLKHELMPGIDSSYRTLSKNMIIGHSFGGLFALHSLIESPDLFSYYILIDPSWFWDHNYIGKRAKEILEQRPDLQARVYISLANNLKDDERHYQWGQEFFQLLDNHPSPELDAKIKYFEDEKHLTVPLISTYYGLRFIFDEFEIDINDIFVNPSIINEHNKKISQKLGVEMNLDERFINTLGYIALHDRNIPDIAVSIFEINTKNYPTSLNVWDSLADAYMAKGLKGQAKTCYVKILSLDPDNADAKLKIQKMN